MSYITKCCGGIIFNPSEKLKKSLGERSTSPELRPGSWPAK